MKENDLSIEKREPGFFASLFGAESETVLVNKEGDVVYKIEKEEPGLLGSLLGEEEKQIVVDDNGEKVGTFETEEPGLIASLLGEKERTVIVDSGGSKVATFEREDPGVIESLMGGEAKTVLKDNEGAKLGTFEKEEPSGIGRLLGEKGRRIIRAETGRSLRLPCKTKRIDSGSQNSQQGSEEMPEQSDVEEEITPTRNDEPGTEVSQELLEDCLGGKVVLNANGSVDLITEEGRGVYFIAKFESRTEYERWERRWAKVLKYAREKDNENNLL